MARPTLGDRALSRMSLVAFVVLSLSINANGSDAPSGEAIYKAKCVSCHGPSGEGSKEYPHTLAGDRSVAQLSKLIAKTMPSDDPGSCSPEESASVAAYIHESFYSPAAQAKGKPARIELSRLTVHQHRNALSDLIGSLRGSTPPITEHGLKAQYYKSRHFRGNDKVVDRVDPNVSFDFGTGPAIEGKMEHHEFSIRWEGSVVAPETGEYEFLVRTEHAMRLWVNDPNVALIDALVKSGNDNEYKATIYLLAGRSYPLKLEFFKANQGVDDSKQAKKRPPVKASIALLWKPPGGVVEPVPPRCLATSRGPEVYCPSTPFPPDDRSLGYERGSAISKAWDSAETDAAIEAVSYIMTHLKEFTGIRDNDADRAKKSQDLAKRVAERAFRRTLTPELEATYITRPFEKAGDPDAALKRSLLLILKSPRFLYREVGGSGGKPDGFDVASRLAFALWDAPPDSQLLEAAKKGELATRDQVAKQAERMANDPKAKAKLREFFVGWLRILPPGELAKDPKKFPEFTPEVASDLRTSLDLTLDEVIGSERSDYRELLGSESLYMNGRLAKIYGVDLPPDAPFTKVTPEPRERAGVLTHPYLMAAFAYTGTTSPIHRGVFVSRSLLGRTLRPPPEAVAPLAPDLHPSLTTRERVNIQTSPTACMTCHSMVNPLGFTMERFDAIGRYRKEENGRPIDSSGLYQTKTEGTATFAGARDLASFLATSDEAHDAFVRALFHHEIKQSIRAFGPEAQSNLRASFVRNGYSVRKLMTEIAVVAAGLN